MKLPKGVIQVSLDDPAELHNLLADIFGEPRVDPNRRRMLRKDNGVSPKAPGGDSDDGTSEQGK
jgi:hypothetical protein